MKLFLFIIILIVASCSNQKNDSQNSISVSKINGVSIFLYSTPNSACDTLGKIELGLLTKIDNIQKSSVTDIFKNVTSIISTEENIELAVKQSKKEYPTLNALLFDNNLDYAYAIVIDK
jgi:hypothetical protein